jgi:hypothetical protein
MHACMITLDQANGERWGAPFLLLLRERTI